MIPIYLAHYPAGASVKQLYHYAQEINSGKDTFFKQNKIQLIRFYFRTFQTI